MLKLSNIEDVTKTPLELRGAASAIHTAITNKNLVEMRVEDLPNMALDLQLKTKVDEIRIDPENKKLYIDANGLFFMFSYESFLDGSESANHKKCYFQTDNASLSLMAYI